MRLGGSKPAVWKFNKIGFRSIEDGASNTMLAAEKAVSSQNWTIDSGEPWPYWEVYGYYVGADWPIMRQFGALIPGTPSPNSGFPEIPVLGDDDPRTESDEQGFGSAHPGVFLAVFGDGSTHVINNDAELLLLDQLGKRSDGFSVALDTL